MFARSSVSTFESLEHRTLFAAPTDIDNSFSGDGKVITDFGGANDVAHAVAVQSDGRIVVAGETQVTVNGVKKTAFAAVRYNKDGSLDDGGSKDTTKGDKFGTGGKFVRLLDQGGGTGALALAIQKDGKILLAGNAIKSTASGQQWYVLRLKKDGTLDSGFGKSGVQSTNFFKEEIATLRAIGLQPDGKLVMGGSTEGDWHIERLTSSGQFDKSFGGGTGVANADFGGDDIVTAITFDYIGRIVAAGNVGGNSAKQDVGLMRFTSNGNQDFDFGTMGRSVLKTGVEFSDVGTVLQMPNGDIHVGQGGKADPAGLVATLSPIGADLEFNQNGKYEGGFFGYGFASMNGLVSTPTDTLLLGGTSLRSGSEKFYVYARQGGQSKEVNFGSSTDRNFASATTVGPDGKVVQVGYTTAGGGGKNFAIVRYVGTPTSGLGSLSGNVFYDSDGDGVKDANEFGQAKAEVYLDDNNNGAWDRSTERGQLTDINGNYKFFVAPGTYRIRETLPLLVQTFPASAVHVVTAAAKKSITGLNFGHNFPDFSPGTRITGSVFFDFDGDGFRDVANPTEPDLVGRTVYLDLNGNSTLDAGEPNTKTNGGGNYSFDGLTPGNYRVGDILPAGWTHTDPSSGFFDVSVANDQTVVRRFATTFADDDDTISEVNNKPGNQSKVGGSVNFSIANVTDADLVRFTVKKGQKVGFDLDRASGSSLNSFLRLFDAHGNQLATNDDAAAPGESKGSDSYLAYTFNTAGTYYIGVSNNANKSYEPRFGYGDNGAGSTGGYKLSLVGIATSTGTFSQVRVSSIFDRPITESLASSVL